MKYKMSLPVVIFSSVLLISCGGGSSGGGGTGVTYGGATSEAKVDTSNADKLAVAAAGGASEAVASDNAPIPRPSPAASSLLDLSSKTLRSLFLANRTANTPVANVCSSGSVDATNNADNSQMTFTYNNCTMTGSGIVVNGTAVFTQNSDGSFILRYNNFTMVYMGETYNLNTTIECDASYNCSYLSDFSGLDGRTYRVDVDSVYSTGSSSYSINATVYDPDYGYVVINADVTYGSCTGGVPSSGSITYTGSGGSTGSVEFNSCDSFTVTVEGVGTTYSWSDYLP